MSIRDLTILKGALSELRNVRITPHCPFDPAKPDFLLKLPSRDIPPLDNHSAGAYT